MVTANGASLLVNGIGTLEGVTLDGVLDMGNSYNGANLTVANGLKLDGTALVGNPTNGMFGAITFAGTQTLSGNGSVVFGNPVSCANILLLIDAGTTLTIGPGITVHGQNGVIGSGRWYDCYGGPTDVAVVNLGVISADVANGTILINPQSFSNQGLAQGINGGTLALMNNVNDVTNTWSNSGDSLNPQALELADYILVLTPLPSAITCAHALHLYRCRWQVELAFKRLKSLLGAGHVPKTNDQSARAWMQSKLLTALLLERLLLEAKIFSPWGFRLRNDQPVASDFGSA